MICYFLYWFIQFPFLLVSPQKIRWLFFVKAIIVPPTWLALLIWAFVKVPPNSGILAQKSELSGSALSWAWLGALNSALGLYATLGVNIPDFTVSHMTVLRPSILIMRDPRKPRDTQKTKERTRLRIFPSHGLKCADIVSQPIYTDHHYSCCVHVGRLRWHRRDECGYHPLRRNSLGSAQADRQVGQPRRRVLHVFRVCSLHAGHEYLGQLSERWERHDRALPTLYQHPTWASHLRVSWWVGTLPLGHTRKVRNVKEALTLLSLAYLTTLLIRQRDGLSIFHERLHGLPGTYHRNHGH